MTHPATTIEEIIEYMKSRQIPPEKLFCLIEKLEDKIRQDLDFLFQRLAGGHIHEIQSKIGYAKNLITLVIESQGAFTYEKALSSAITQLEDILALYHKANLSTTLKNA